MPSWEYFENFTRLVLLVIFVGLAYISGRDWWNRRRKKGKQNEQNKKSIQ